MALVGVLAVPLAATAGDGMARAGGALVPSSLLAAAQANPGKSFKVIAEGATGQSSTAVANALGAAGGRASKKFHAINGVAGSVSGKALVALSHDKQVGAIVPDAPVPLADYVNEEIWRATTGVSALYGVLAPSATPTIAIVDSGIDASKIADFGGRVVARANFVSTDTTSTGDPEGHGTMVAGIAAGASLAYPGVARSAKLVDVRVADSQGQAMTSDILAGVDWILANKARYGIRVANLSLAGTTDTSIRFDPLDQAVEKLWLNGVVVVAAAGNNGSANGAVPLAAPGNDPFVITVGAVDPNQTSKPVDDFRAPWSAYGYTDDGFSKPDLSAPGRYMVAPVPMSSYLATQAPNRVLAPGYMWMSGTSFSTPIVAGAAAQVLAWHPSWTPDQVKGALMASAYRLNGAGTTGTGIGEVNAQAATQVTSPPNPNDGLNAFVSLDPTTGYYTFNASNWVSTVSTSSNWTESNWVSSNWTSGAWSASNWTSSNWTSSNWTSSNWTESNWVE